MRDARATNLIEPDYGAVSQAALHGLGLDVSRDQAAELLEATYISGIEGGKAPFDDARATLLELRRRGFLLGTVTNRAFGGERFRADIRAAGLDIGWDVEAVSIEVGYLKPHPSIFLYALEQLDVAPSETLMVGNSLAEDIAGAQRLGMSAAWRRSLPDAEAVTPDFTFDELLRAPRLPELAGARLMAGEQRTWGGASPATWTPSRATTRLASTGPLRARHRRLRRARPHARQAGHHPAEDADAIIAGLALVLERLPRGPRRVAAPNSKTSTRTSRPCSANRIGEAAGRLHTARSRNDQVSLLNRLVVREACDDAIEASSRFIRVLCTLAEEHAADPMPGYTHVQRAQPVTLGHHLLAYGEMLLRDRDRFRDCRRRTNVMPLGSGRALRLAVPARPRDGRQGTGLRRHHPQQPRRHGRPRLRAEFIAACAITQMHISRLAEEIVALGQRRVRLRLASRRLRDGLQHDAPEEERRCRRARAWPHRPGLRRTHQHPHEPQGPTARLQPRPAGRQGGGLRRRRGRHPDPPDLRGHASRPALQPRPHAPGRRRKLLPRHRCRRLPREKRHALPRSARHRSAASSAPAKSVAANSTSSRSPSTPPPARSSSPTSSTSLSTPPSPPATSPAAPPLARSASQQPNSARYSPENGGVPSLGQVCLSRSSEPRPSGSGAMMIHLSVGPLVDVLRLRIPGAQHRSASRRARFE